MRIIAKSTLKGFWGKNKDAEVPLKVWFRITQKADWADSKQLKATFGNASIINVNRIVFNIKGNKYRLVVHIIFKTKTGYIRFIGKHCEYDRIDVKTIKI